MDRGFPSHVSDAEIERIGQDATRRRAERAEKRIAELEEQNKWISVDERLPEEGQSCLFYYGTIDGEPEMEAGFWEAAAHFPVGYSWECHFTHWKPITPPEKDDE